MAVLTLFEPSRECVVLQMFYIQGTAPVSVKQTNESLTIRVLTVQSSTLPVRQGFHPMNLTSVRSEVCLKFLSVMCSLCLSFVWKEDCALLAHIKQKKKNKWHVFFQTKCATRLRVKMLKLIQDLIYKSKIFWQTQFFKIYFQYTITFV